MDGRCTHARQPPSPPPPLRPFRDLRLLAFMSRKPYPYSVLSMEIMVHGKYRYHVERLRYLCKTTKMDHMLKCDTICSFNMQCNAPAYTENARIVTSVLLPNIFPFRRPSCEAARSCCRSRSSCIGIVTQAASYICNAFRLPQQAQKDLGQACSNKYSNQFTTKNVSRSRADDDM